MCKCNPNNRAIWCENCKPTSYAQLYQNEQDNVEEMRLIMSPEFRKAMEDFKPALFNEMQRVTHWDFYNQLQGMFHYLKIIETNKEFKGRERV